MATITNGKFAIDFYRWHLAGGVLLEFELPGMKAEAVEIDSTAIGHFVFVTATQIKVPNPPELIVSSVNEGTEHLILDVQSVSTDSLVRTSATFDEPCHTALYTIDTNGTATCRFPKDANPTESRSNIDQQIQFPEGRSAYRLSDGEGIQIFVVFASYEPMNLEFLESVCQQVAEVKWPQRSHVLDGDFVPLRITRGGVFVDAEKRGDVVEDPLTSWGEKVSRKFLTSLKDHDITFTAYAFAVSDQ